MRIQFICGYVLTGALLVWSLFSQNFEFLFYGITTVILVALLHKGDQHFSFGSNVLWGFNIWIILHILGGLLPVGDSVLYSFLLLDMVGEPYSILKYDQIVHFYCYFIAALLIWKIVSDLNSSSMVTTSIITILAASGIGGVNEIIEFLATVFIPDTNVGGYENTAIDIICNFLGACAAAPFFKHKKTV
jgi:putative membrane protein